MLLLIPIVTARATNQEVLNPGIPREAAVAQVAGGGKLEERARLLTTTSQVKVGTSQQHSEWRNLKKLPNTKGIGQPLATDPLSTSIGQHHWVTRQERVQFLPFARIFSGGRQNKGFASRHHK